MAKLTLKKALTDVTVYLFVQDSSKTTGEGLTGLAYNTANLVASYVRPLGSRTAITLATLAEVTSAHTDGGFKEIDATNMPGVYRLDLPDAVCATGVPSAVVMLKGASNMTPVLLEIQLTDFDLNSTSNTVGTVTNLTNLPSIPNNWLTAAGIAADARAEIADAVWDEAISGHTTAGSFGAKNQKVVPSETIGDYKADVSSLATSAALATVGSNVTSIKTKTDNLPASPAAVGSEMTLSNNAITAAVIATDAIDADAIKADAVSEIQSGLATASALATVAGYVDDLEGRLTATRAGYLDKLNVSGTLAHSDAAATYKADVSGIPAAVWGHATRTLSSFGTLVSDIWSAATRTLSAFAFTVTGAKDTSIDAIKAKTDTIPASPAAVGSPMTLTVGERTAIANEVESQIIDDTDAEKVLKAITDKIASVNPSLDDLTLAGIASAVRTELTTELARIDAAISTRLATAGYTAPANADISAIKTKTDQLAFTVANQVDANALTGSATAEDVRIEMDANSTKLAEILTDTGTDGVVLKASGLAADAVTKIQNGLATPTNITAGTISTVTTVTNGVTLADDAITAAKFDESTAFPVKSADTGATQIARVGADSDTLETLSDQLDAVKAKTDMITTGITVLTIASPVIGSTITAIRGDTLVAVLEGIGSLVGYSKVYFTVKRDYADADTAAIIQIENTAGLKYLNGAAGTPANGSLTIVDEASGDITIALDEVETAKLDPGVYSYDVQVVRTAGSVSTLTAGTFEVAADVTRATA